MRSQVIHLSGGKDVTLTTYILDNSKEMPNSQDRPAILICPGGGYEFCSEHEAEPVAMASLVEGYNAFVLRYSVKENAKFPQPLSDAEEALTLIRTNAKEWGVNPNKIAACGFSAGGHLAACLGTMGKVRPNALILGYPVIKSKINIPLATEIPSLEERVNKDTPTTFLFAASDDFVVPIEHSLSFMTALQKNGILFESVIFQKGGHGFSLSKPATASENGKFNRNHTDKWLGLCIKWLIELGWGFSDNYEEEKKYSINLPLGTLWKNEACKDLIIDMMPQLKDAPQIAGVMNLKLRKMLEHSDGLTKELIEELNQKLGEIPVVA